MTEVGHHGQPVKHSRIKEKACSKVDAGDLNVTLFPRVASEGVCWKLESEWLLLLCLHRWTRWKQGKDFSQPPHCFLFAVMSLVTLCHEEENRTRTKFSMHEHTLVYSLIGLHTFTFHSSSQLFIAELYKVRWCYFLTPMSALWRNSPAFLGLCVCLPSNLIWCQWG